VILIVYFTHHIALRIALFCALIIMTLYKFACVNFKQCLLVPDDLSQLGLELVIVDFWH